MRRGWVVAAIAAAGAYAVLGRRWQLRWGAYPQECAATLPGDDLIGHPDLTATRAITVHAPADRVWPWIAQMGQGRGGFYSYDVLENLAGCHIHSSDHIEPGLQAVAVGDEIRLAPQVALRVAALVPGASLVLSSGAPPGGTPPPYDFTWAFVLREQPDGSTRLVVRERYGYTRRWTPLLAEPVEAASFVMSQKMLRGIRDRAEHASAAH